MSSVDMGALLPSGVSTPARRARAIIPPVDVPTIMSKAPVGWIGFGTSSLSNCLKYDHDLEWGCDVAIVAVVVVVFVVVVVVVVVVDVVVVGCVVVAVVVVVVVILVAKHLSGSLSFPSVSSASRYGFLLLSERHADLRGLHHAVIPRCHAHETHSHSTYVHCQVLITTRRIDVCIVLVVP